MRVHIENAAKNDPPLPWMEVDNHRLMVDLSKAGGELPVTDPTVLRVTWAPVTVNGEQRECGAITRQDGTIQRFWDRTLLKPYLAAFEARKAELGAPAKDSA